MRLFRKLLRGEPEEELVTDKSRNSNIEPFTGSEDEDGGEYSEDSSFNWLGDDQDYSSIPESLRGTDDEKSSTDTVTARTLAITEESPYTVEVDTQPDDTVPTKTLTLSDSSALMVEEDTGSDPYNSSRSKVTKR